MQSLLANLRLAWRDLRAQGGRSIFFVLLVAVGVASLVGVQGLALSLGNAPASVAKTMVQGDLKITHDKELTQAQSDALAAIRKDGAQTTEIWDTPAHATVVNSSKKNSMIQLKGVDPKVWPFYGGFKAEGGKSIDQLLQGDGDAVVAPELLDRLAMKVGDKITVGKSTFTISGVVNEEPMDISSGQIGLGPRVFVTLDAVKQALGGGQYYVTTVKLPSGLSIEAASTRLGTAFAPGKELMTYEEVWKQLSKVMDSLFTFLNMVAFIALLVGGLGVAMAMRTFISQKLEHIAILKSLGSTNRSIMFVFLAQAVILGTLGSILGAAAGVGIQQYLPTLYKGIFPAVNNGFSIGAVLGGLLAGVATSVICALIPVRAVRNVKAIALFRGESGAAKGGWKVWLETVLLGAVVIGGLGWLAARYAKSMMIGFGFLGSLLVAALVLLFFGWLVLIFTRLLAEVRNPAVRYAVRSTYAPGNQSKSVVVSMGMGILIMSAVYLLQNGVVKQVSEVGVGENTPNVFVMGVPGAKKDEMFKFLESHPGVRKVDRPSALATASVVSIDGKTAEELKLQSFWNNFQMVDTNLEMSKAFEVTSGDWFTSDDVGKPYLTLSDDGVKLLGGGVKVGSRIMLLVKGQNVEFTVKNIRALSGGGFKSAADSIIATAPGALDKYVDGFILMAYAKPHQDTTVVTDVMTQFPGPFALSMGAIIDVFTTFLDKLLTIVRFITGATILAALVILSGSLSATAMRRRKEAALLKTLGGTRAMVAFASALENGLLGAVAGLVGCGLASGMMAAASTLIKVPAAGSWTTVAIATGAGALLAILAGLAMTIDVLNVKPLTVLRSE